MPKVIQEEIQINQITPGVTLSPGVTTVDTEIIRFSVPDKSQLEIRPTDFLALYLADSTPAEVETTALITILRMDAVGRRTKILAQGEYTQFKAMTNAMEKYYYRGGIEVVPAKFLLVVKVKAIAVIDESKTRFTQSCKFVYETIE